MTTHTSIAKKGWVIAFWMVLVICFALLPPLGNMVLHRHEKTLQPKAAMKGLEIAIRGHQTEYSSISLKEFWKSENEAILSEGEILKVLMAENERLNPRMIRFYDPPILRCRFSRRVGTVLNEKGELRLVDERGNPFWLLLDLDGDKRIPNPDPIESEEMDAINAPVILYSSGDDGDPNTWQDNLKSWN